MIDTSFWMAVGSIAGTAATGVTLLRHIFGYAYRQGQLDTRIGALEKQVEKGVDTNQAIATLNAAVEGLKASIDKLDAFLDRRVGALEDRVNGAPTPSRRRAVVG
jgi:uncharacterized coiled-coil protein SlyX